MDVQALLCQCHKVPVAYCRFFPGGGGGGGGIPPLPKTNVKIEDVAAYRFVNEDTPPCFVWHTYADSSVPVRNALDFANALEANKVPFALHIYYDGRHGLGLGNQHPWANELIFWLKEIGVLRK